MKELSTKFFIILFYLSLSLCAVQAQILDTLTVMHYNLTYFGNTGGASIGCNNTNNNAFTKSAHMRTIVSHYKPDIFTCNELGNNSVFVNFIRDSVMTASGYAPFSAGTYTNNAGSTIVNALFFNSQKLALQSQQVIAHSLRDINLYRLYYKDPLLSIGADTSFISLIVIHMKAGSTSADQTTRLQQSNAIMNVLNGINTAGNYLLCGDLNIQSSGEASYQRLVNYTPNPKMQFFDPINLPGVYNNNGTFALVHTQSTVTVSDGCKASGGLDDRFDFILASRFVMQDSAGYRYIPGSYQACGQDGQRFNKALNDPTPPNTSVPAAVLSALSDASDHLPVLLRLQVKRFNIASLPQDAALEPLIRIQNPVENTMRIFYDKRALALSHIQIIDLYGNTMLYAHHSSDAVTMEDHDAIDVSALPNGMYFVRVTLPDGRSKQGKLIKR